VFKEDDLVDGLYLITGGIAKIQIRDTHKLPDGDEKKNISVAIVGPGQVLGEYAVAFEKTKRRYTILANTYLTSIFLPLATLQKQVSNVPLKISLIKAIATRMTHNLLFQLPPFDLMAEAKRTEYLEQNGVIELVSRGTRTSTAFLAISLNPGLASVKTFTLAPHWKNAYHESFLEQMHNVGIFLGESTLIVNRQDYMFELPNAPPGFDSLVNNFVQQGMPSGSRSARRPGRGRPSKKLDSKKTDSKKDSPPKEDPPGGEEAEAKSHDSSDSLLGKLSVEIEKEYDNENFAGHNWNSDGVAELVNLPGFIDVTSPKISRVLTRGPFAKSTAPATRGKTKIKQSTTKTWAGVRSRTSLSLRITPAEQESSYPSGEADPAVAALQTWRFECCLDMDVTQKGLVEEAAELADASPSGTPRGPRNRRGNEQVKSSLTLT
jgi:hypothetical protein